MTIHLSDGIVDLEGGVVLRGEERVPLTAIEQRFLTYLALRPGRIVDRSELLVEVWGYRPGVNSRTIDNASRRIREKIELDPSEPIHLISVYGRGVKLEGAVGPRADETRRAAVRRIGRHEELVALEQAFGDGARVVLVRGPAGAGKSHLAGELAGQAGWVVADVAGATDALGVQAEVARALETPPARIVGALAATSVLVLDGCDRAADAVRELANRWMSAVPTLRVLATSRAPLGIGERVVPLGPLPVTDAIVLFSELVRTHTPGFRLAPSDRDELARLLRAIDCLPLAIELLAAAIPAGAKDPISVGLAHVARGGGPNGIRAAVEGSIAALSPKLRGTLAALTVFAGPFTLEDVENVVGDTRAADGVLALCERSLVHAVEPEGPVLRFAVYELVSDAVRARTTPGADLLERHAAWFARLGSAAEIARVRSDQTALERLAAAAADLAAILERASQSAPELAGAAAVALLVHHRRTEQLEAGAALVARSGALQCSAGLKAAILMAACDLDLVRGGGEVFTLASRGLALPIEPLAAFHLRMQRGRAMMMAGRNADAAADFERCAERLGEMRDEPWHVGTWHRYRADLWLREYRLAEARVELDLARAALREAGAVVDQVMVGIIAGHALSEAAEWEAAEQALEDASTAASEIRLPSYLEAGLHGSWATLERNRGRMAEAARHLDAAAAVLRRSGHLQSLGEIVRRRAIVSWMSGRTTEAATDLEGQLANQALGQGDHAAHLLTTLAVLRYAVGNYAGARTAIDLAIEAAGAAGISDAELDGTRGLLDAHFGELELGRCRVARARAELEAAGMVVCVARMAAISAVLESRYGSAEEARDALARAWAECDALGIGPESDVGWWIRQADSEVVHEVAVPGGR